MARLVKHDSKGPKEISVANERFWICMCGLSSNKPFCNGAHKMTHDEDPEKTYIYNHIFFEKMGSR